MRNKKRSIFIKLFYIIHIIINILLAILVPIGIVALVPFETPILRLSFQILILFVLYGGMYYMRKSLIIDSKSNFLRLISKTRNFKFKYGVKGLLYIVVGMPIIILFFVFAQNLFDKYVNSTSPIIAQENKIIIPQRIAELSKTLNVIDSSNKYIILNELGNDPKYERMFYSTDGGKTKKINDKTYVLNNLKTYKDRIYESVDWGRDQKVKLSDDDLEKIAAGFFDGSITFDHHNQSKYNALSDKNHTSFEYNGKKYLAYDLWNEKLRQQGYHTWAVPMTTADFREKLFYINSQLVRMTKK